MGITEVLTVIFVTLHCIGVGECASWAIIAWPWHWSCLCLEIWALVFYFALFVIGAVVGFLDAFVSSK